MAQRRTLARAALAAAGLAAMLATAAPAGATPAGAATVEGRSSIQTAARSTQVSLVNWSSCELRLQNAWLDHGVWSDGLAPEPVIPDGVAKHWQSESNGFLTGTEGHVIYDAFNCKVSVLNGKRVQLHWNNPYAGSNSYDNFGSDPNFRFGRNGGDGNNASVYWQIMTP
ncbi:aegerolysin family protein [Kitasatospora purpeofusca]|uniref:aegerolysin family protein n=1 Tax=Kitasatospora purpeofusca TaxID=67352 RepID=UPI0004C020B5|nr:aegerolysin family protein [Kitasatospora purpeofusca]